MENLRDVLVITVPPNRITPEGFSMFREYVIESILRDVLVLDSDMKMSVEQVPALEIPKILVGVDLSEKGDFSPSAAPEPECIKPTAREEKQKILDRLIAYRDKYGLGSFNDVANKTRVKAITADTLRMLIKGDAVLNIAEWRAVGRALDELEKDGDPNA